MSVGGTATWVVLRELFYNILICWTLYLISMLAFSDRPWYICIMASYCMGFAQASANECMRWSHVFEYYHRFGHSYPKIIWCRFFGSWELTMLAGIL